MTGVLTNTVYTIAWATFLLSFGFCTAAALLGMTRCRSWRIHRTAWFAVLLLGVLAFLPSPLGKTVEIPVLPEVPLEVPPEAESVFVPEVVSEPIDVFVSATASPETLSSENHEPVISSEAQRSEKSHSSEEALTEFARGGEISRSARNDDLEFSSSRGGADQGSAAKRGFAIVVFIWLGGMLWLPIRMFFRTIRFQRHLRETEPACEEWFEVWQSLQTERAVRRTVPMLTAEDPAIGPALVWRPSGFALVVPLEGWDRLSETERESVMRHELEHFLRHDIPKSLFARILAMPHWFNPLAWQTVHRFEDAAEWACDEAALRGGTENLSDFARALVSLHETAMLRPTVAADGALQHNIFGRNISRRVARLLSFGAQQKKESAMKKIFLIVAGLLLLATSLVQVKLVAKNAEAETPTEVQNNEPGTASPELPREETSLAVHSEADASGSFAEDLDEELYNQIKHASPAQLEATTRNWYYDKRAELEKYVADLQPGQEKEPEHAKKIEKLTQARDKVHQYWKQAHARYVIDVKEKAENELREIVEEQANVKRAEDELKQLRKVKQIDTTAVSVEDIKKVEDRITASKDRVHTLKTQVLARVQNLKARLEANKNSIAVMEKALEAGTTTADQLDDAKKRLADLEQWIQKTEGFIQKIEESETADDKSAVDAGLAWIKAKQAGEKRAPATAQEEARARNLYFVARSTLEKYISELKPEQKSEPKHVKQIGELSRAMDEAYRQWSRINAEYIASTESAAEVKNPEIEYTKLTAEVTRAELKIMQEVLRLHPDAISHAEIVKAVRKLGEAEKFLEQQKTIWEKQHEITKNRVKAAMDEVPAVEKALKEKKTTPDQLDDAQKRMREAIADSRKAMINLALINDWKKKQAESDERLGEFIAKYAKDEEAKKETAVSEIKPFPAPSLRTDEREATKETYRRSYENSRAEVVAVEKAWRDGTTTFDQLVDAQTRLIGAEFMLRACDPEAKIEPTKPLPITEALERYKNRNEALADPAYRELIVRWMNAVEEMLRRQFKTIVEKNPLPTDVDFQKEVCFFYDEVYELYEILGDRPAMQTLLNNQSRRLHQLHQKAIAVETPYFAQLIESRSRMATILRENTNRLTRIVPEGTKQVSTTLEHPLDFWRQRMTLKHKEYLETEIKYLNGAQGGRTVDREKARLGWLEARVEYDFFNADLADLRIAALLREESAKNFLQAAKVFLGAGVVIESVVESIVKEAEMEVAAAAFAPNNLPVQDIAALEKGEPDPNGKPTVLCLKIVRSSGPPTNRRPGVPFPAPAKPVSPQVESHGYNVWEFFGIRYGEMSKGLWKTRAGNHFDKFPHGGVLVTETKNDGLFHRLGVRKGDMIVGIREWCVTSQNDLLYIINAWPYNSGPTRLLLIRDDQLYYVDIPDDKRPREAPTLQVVKDGKTVGELKLRGEQEPGQNLRGLTPPDPNAPAHGVDPDYVKLLEKRVELSKQLLSQVEAMYKFGAEGGRAHLFHDAQVRYAGNRAVLYQYAGDREKYLTALKEKHAAAESKKKALDANYRVGTATVDQVTDADLALAEAEYELKQAEKTVSSDAPLEKTITLDFQQRPWTEVLEYLAKQSGMTLSIRNKPIAGSFSSTDKRKYTLPEAVEVLNSVLKTQGYSLTQRGNTLVLDAFNPEKEPKKTLTFQGKTFEQWVEELKTELDPKLRAEAFRALAMFGANGRGKEATAVIVDAVAGINFDSFSQDAPMENMKFAAKVAFTDNVIRISFEDSMPTLMKNFTEGDANAQSFAKNVFSALKHGDGAEELIPLFYRELMQWKIDNRKDDRPLFLLRCLAVLDPDGESMLQFVQDALEKNDEERFRLPFVDLTPARFNGDYLLIGENNDWATPLGLFPCAVGSTARLSGGAKKLENLRLSPFGKSLLKLLQEKGVTAKNATIRETSTKVVEALLSVDKDE